MGKSANRTANLQKRGFTAESLQVRNADPCKKKIARATERNYKDAADLWDEFCAYKEISQDLVQGAPVPDVVLMKEHMKFWAASSTGRLNEMPNLTSAEVVWQRLQAVIFRNTGNKVPRKENEDMLAWIRGELVDEFNLPRNKHAKGFCDAVVYNDLMVQLWRKDSDEFEWERDRVQTAFLLQLHQFSGGRPGAFMPTVYYDNLYLEYSDMEFMLHRDKNDEGKEKFGIVLSQRWRKGEKDKVDQNLRILWLEEDDLLNCPVSHFLSLAFADDAFNEIKSRSDLEDMKLDASTDIRVFSYKPEMRCKPFLINRDGTPLQYHRFWYNLKALSHRTGYLDHVRPYDIRRATADTLHEASGVSTNSVNQLIGHASHDVYMRHYQSFVSAVDIKGYVLRGKADEGFSTLALRRNRRLKRVPPRLPSRLHHKYLSDWRKATMEEPENKAKLGNRARTAAWKEFRNQLLDESSETNTPPEPRTSLNLPNSIEMLGSLVNPITKSRIMMHYDLHRKSISDAVALGKYDMRSSSALDSMVCLAKRDYVHPAVFYPGTEPIKFPSGTIECRYCHHGIAKKTVAKQKVHVDICAVRHHKVSWEKIWNPRMCHRCNAWFSRLEDYRSHLKLHLEELDSYCGILRLRNIVVSAGRCPFCLSDSTFLNWGEFENMVTSFQTSDAFMEHLRKHIKEIRAKEQPLACPHPLCERAKLYEVDDLLHHFYDDHGIADDLFSNRKLVKDPPRVRIEDLSVERPLLEKKRKVAPDYTQPSEVPGSDTQSHVGKRAKPSHVTFCFRAT